MKKALLILASMVMSICAFAHKDTLKRCGSRTDNAHIVEMNKTIENYLIAEKSASDFELLRKKIITIPIVLHIVYKKEHENLVDSTRIKSQIDVLNAAFRMKNSDEIKEIAPKKFQRVAGDMRIKFKLDQIIRIETETDFYYADDSVKRESPVVSPDNRLNIWVCDLEEGLLGYAQFPGEDTATDGVVVDIETFGVINVNDSLWYAPYTKGDNLVHEIGHWLGLFHIWGDDCFWAEQTGMSTCFGSDHVEDTPNQGCMSFGCLEPGSKSCGDVEIMYMNYMDYSDDACLCMFTKGQADRARAVLNTLRKGFVK